MSKPGKKVVLPQITKEKKNSIAHNPSISKISSNHTPVSSELNKNNTRPKSNIKQSNILNPKKPKLSIGSNNINYKDSSNSIVNKDADTSKSKILSYSRLGGQSKLDASNKTKVIGEIEQENEDERRRTELNAKLDNFILTSAKNKKYKSTLENNGIEKAFYTKLKDCSKKININNLSDNKSKEENDKFELVEKSYLDKFREENEVVKRSINEIKEKLKELKLRKFKETGELNCKKFLSDNQDKLKSDNVKELENLIKENDNLELINSKLKSLYTGVTVDKNSIYSAVVDLLKEFDKKLANEFLTIYHSFNNEGFVFTNKVSEEEKIEKLLGKISLLQYQIEYDKALKKAQDKLEKDFKTISDYSSM
jgi:hypothetical protein